MVDEILFIAFHIGLQRLYIALSDIQLGTRAIILDPYNKGPISED